MRPPGGRLIAFARSQDRAGRRTLAIPIPTVCGRSVAAIPPPLPREKVAQPDRTPTDRSIRVCPMGRLTGSQFHYRQVMVICKSHDGRISPTPSPSGSRPLQEVVTAS